MSKEIFEPKHSTKLVELQGKHAETIKKDAAATVYSALLEDQVQTTQKWMLEVAKKASIKHAELVTSCDKAKNIKQDVHNYNEDGVAVSMYSEKTWKEKTTPFKQLSILSAAIDKAMTSGEVKDFEELEKLLK